MIIIGFFTHLRCFRQERQIAHVLNHSCNLFGLWLVLSDIGGNSISSSGRVGDSLFVTHFGIWRGSHWVCSGFNCLSFVMKTFKGRWLVSVFIILCFLALYVVISRRNLVVDLSEKVGVLFNLIFLYLIHEFVLDLSQVLSDIWIVEHLRGGSWSWP